MVRLPSSIHIFAFPFSFPFSFFSSSLSSSCSSSFSSPPFPDLLHFPRLLFLPPLDVEVASELLKEARADKEAKKVK